MKRDAFDSRQEANLLLVFDNVVLNSFRFDLGLGLVLFNGSFGEALSGSIFNIC